MAFHFRCRSPKHPTGKSVFSSQNINATLEKAASLGGFVVKPKFSPDGTAQLALVADSEGHVLGLTEVAHRAEVDRDPPQAVP